MNIQIAIQKMKISSTSKTCDMSDILALIAYVQFSIGQIHFTEFAFFCNFARNRIYVLGVEVLEPVVLARKHNAFKSIR